MINIECNVIVTYFSIQNDLQPVHLAAMVGHVEVLQYLVSLPSVDASAKSNTVCIIRSHTCTHYTVIVRPH